MASFQFIHCADLHIDSPLRGLEADADAPAERIRGATRHAFVALVDRAIELNVAFVLAAGDLYDGEWQDWRTGQFLVSQVGRLSRGQIPFIAIRGNHDAESIITRRLTLPEPARLLRANRPETVTLSRLDVSIHGQSFRTRSVTDNIALAYPPHVPGHFNIGLLHTSVDGRAGHDDYAPCTVGQLRDHGYDYWALGHVHEREILCRNPWVVFPGNTQGRHIREPGVKGVTLVTVQDGRISREPEHLVLDTVRWAQIPVDLTGAVDEDTALALVRASVAAAIGSADGRLLAARILLRGACQAHGVLSRDPGATRDKIRIDALALAGADAIWTEHVSIRTDPPDTELATNSLLLSALEGIDQDTLGATVAEYCRDMLNRAPGLRDALGADHTAVAAAAGDIKADLLARARALLLSRLGEA
jgi:DNA repair protein SbcD/Mre11